MYSIAPTSRPRVGWEATSTRGSWSSSRASTTRCWLPPESDHSGASGPEHWISNSSMSRSALSWRRPRSITPLVAHRPGSTITRFSATDMSSTTPESWRSSGITPIPARAMAPGRLVETSAPSTVTDPRASGRSDDRRSPRARCPLPSTPAIPRISPGRTVMDRSSSTRVPLPTVATAPSTRSTGGSVSSTASLDSSGESSATASVSPSAAPSARSEERIGCVGGLTHLQTRCDPTQALGATFTTPTQPL